MVCLSPTTHESAEKPSVLSAVLNDVAEQRKNQARSAGEPKKDKMPDTGFSRAKPFLIGIREREGKKKRVNEKRCFPSPSCFQRALSALERAHVSGLQERSGRLRKRNQWEPQQVDGTAAPLAQGSVAGSIWLQDACPDVAECRRSGVASVSRGQPEAVSGRTEGTERAAPAGAAFR